MSEHESKREKIKALVKKLGLLYLQADQIKREIAALIREVNGRL